MTDFLFFRLHVSSKKLMFSVAVFLYSSKALITIFFLSCEQYSDLRYSTDLCDEEKEFREKRKAIVFEAMNKMLGDQGPQTMDEVRCLDSFKPQ